ncbi:ornithine cyclodeaminase family protein [Pontiella desulfatans]|nr:ornithine cyclodeaminase family protein [Pontiella desulfatans]
MNKTTTDTAAHRQPMKIIKRSEMANCYTMAEAIDGMSRAFASLSSGECEVPHRYIVNTSDDAMTLLSKPVFVTNQDKFCVKILTQKNTYAVPGIPTILGVVLLMDAVTGEILAMMDGDFITAIRTGAASGLATKYLAREDSRTLAVFGCGGQGRTQLEAVDAVRDIEKIWVFDPSREHAERFVEDMSRKTKASIEIGQDLSVLKEVDIICTATNAQRPLFYKEHLKKGTHINAIGSFRPEMQELDPAIIHSSRSYFDDMEDCLNESGDYLKAIGNAGHSSEDSSEWLAGEIGACVLGRIGGRINPDETTIFKSVGTAIQDFVVAEEIYGKSKADGFGTEIRLNE